MRWHSFLPIIALCCLVLLSGCTQPETHEIPTPTLTPTVPTPDLSPGPIDTIPYDYRVFVEVSRGTQSFNPVIRVEFRGGPGMRLVSSVDTEVIRADGTIGTATLTTPAIGEYMEIPGTTETDRVIVYARMMNGERYRIYDQVLEFRG